MFDFGLLQKIIVTLEAKLCAGAREKAFGLGRMRIVTTRAFSGLRGSVFDLRFFEKIIVALKTKSLASTCQQPLGL